MRRTHGGLHQHPASPELVEQLLEHLWSVDPVPESSRQVAQLLVVFEILKKVCLRQEVKLVVPLVGLGSGV